jgi:D-arabinose 1-dehydrogenase-like Zn-dependent alcohol dehydrogenase
MSETYKAIEVRKPGKFAEVRRPLQDPGHDQVRIRVEACGVCHSDAATVEGGFPGITYPRVPGHEVVGRIDAAGSGAFTGDPATGDATLRFSVLSGASAMIETVPLGQAAAAYAKMMSGKARFRMVLTMER